MREVRIEVAKPIHVGMAARRLRSEDRAEIEVLYGDCRKAIRRVFRGSSIRKVAFVDGEIAALWGVYGSLLAVEPFMWLVTTPAIEKIPMRFLRECRREVAELLQSRNALRGVAAASYTKAIRFLELVGFKVCNLQEINGELFCELEAR